MKKSNRWIFIALLWLLSAATASANEKQSDEAEQILSDMTLEEKVAQIFFITPDALTGVSGVTSAGEYTESQFQNYPVGGFILFSANIQSEQQTTELLSGMQRISEKRIKLPVFTGIDEEGGTVTRIAGRGILDTPYYESMYKVGVTQNDANAYLVGIGIGKYLAKLGFNLDFAPVADIWSNSDNTVIGTRSFGNDSATVAMMVASAVKGLHAMGVMSTLKHFPGHGDTAEDSHSGFAYTYRTLEELRSRELIPFAQGIEAGTDFIMMGHISMPNVLDSDIPASMSWEVVTGILREELGFEGIIITDAMNMGAISNYYSSSDAAVKAVNAGVDMILMPADFSSAYNGLLNAVKEGSVTEERINESVRRIIKKKLELKT